MLVPDQQNPMLTSFALATLFVAGVSFATAFAFRGMFSTSKSAPNEDDWKLADSNPTQNDFGYPLIGNAFKLVNEGRKLFLLHRNQSVWFTRVLMKKAAVFTSTEASQKVWKGEGSYVEYSNSFLGLKELGGKSVANAVDPKEHANLRKAMLKCFRPSTVRLSAPAIQALVSRFAKRWAEESVFDAQDQLAKVAFQAGATFIGLHPENMSEKYVEVLHTALIQFARGLLVPRIDLGKFSPFGRARKARKVLQRETRKIIEECQEKLKNGEDVEDGILRQLVEATDEDGKLLSMECMQDNLIVFTNGAADTTASTMLSFFLCLCQQPEIQDRMHEHIKDILGADSDEFAGRKLILWEQMENMTYIDDVISECERFCPPLFSSGIRSAARDFEVCGEKIEKGSDLIIDAISRTRNPEYWGDDAHEFNPDRFTNNPSLRKLLATFGGGRRMCIGNGFANLERKIVAVSLMRGYRISFVDAEAAKSLKLIYNSLLQIDGGKLPVRIETRSNMS